MATTPDHSVPLLKHRDWRFLLRDLVSANRALQPLTGGLLKHGLTAPASIGWWLLQFRPDLLERESLNIVIAGAGYQECADSGRWLSFLPWLVGRPNLKVSVSLVGDQLTVSEEHTPQNSTGRSLARLEDDWRTPAAGALASRPAATIVNGLLEQWHAMGPALPDLCVLFAPGFESHHREWLREDALLPLLRDKVPTAAFSYSLMDFRGDQYILSACGLPQASPSGAANPWSVETPATEFIGHFANYAWSLTAPAGELNVKPDDEKIRRFVDATRYLRRSYEQLGDKVLEFMGALETVRFEDEDGESAKEDVFILPDGFVVRREDGVVLESSDDGRLEEFDEDRPLIVPGNDLASWPSEPGVERVIWAVDIHRKHVAPRVTARQYESFLPDAMPDSEVLQGLAEAHATLEGRSCRPGTPGSSAFFTALEEGRFDEAGRLAQETPQLLAAQDEDGKTGLMLAYDAGQHELVQRWVATPGAALNAKDTEGFALAHDVVRSDNVSVLGLLHKNGADLNIRTLGGFTPAIMCLDYRAEDCLRFLVQHRADLNVRSMGGRNVPEDLEQADLPEDVKKLVRDALLADRG